MTKPKIAIFTETYHPVVGGGETQARLLAEALVADGFAVILLTRRSDSSFAAVEQYGAVTVHRLPPSGSGQLKKWRLLLSGLPALVRLRGRYDLVFVSGFRILGIVAVPVARLFRKPCVLKADSLGEMSGEFFRGGLARIRLQPTSLAFRVFLGLRNFVLRRAAAFAAITPEIAEEIAACGVKRAAIELIPNCVDTNRFHPVSEERKHELRDKLGLPRTGKVAIYTGRLVSYKGLPRLLEVWREIQHKHTAVTLLLVGTGGLDIHNCESALKQFVEAHDLQHAIRFTGTVQNVPEYLQASDLFVFPTENDAFPSSLIEAMVCGLPVVATPVGAIKTIVEDGRNGLIVQPRDTRQLYAALDALLSDPDLAMRLGRAGHETVQERYSAQTVARQYIDLFCRLTDRNGRVGGAGPESPRR